MGTRSFVPSWSVRMRSVSLLFRHSLFGLQNFRDRHNGQTFSYVFMKSLYWNTIFIDQYRQKFSADISQLKCRALRAIKKIAPTASKSNKNTPFNSNINIIDIINKIASVYSYCPWMFRILHCMIGFRWNLCTATVQSIEYNSKKNIIWSINRLITSWYLKEQSFWS